MAPRAYSIDSSSLIHAWRRVYRIKNFPRFWTLLDRLAADGRLKSSIEVYNELERKDDELFAWCKDSEAAFSRTFKQITGISPAAWRGQWPD